MDVWISALVRVEPEARRGLPLLLHSLLFSFCRSTSPSLTSHVKTKQGKGVIGDELRLTIISGSFQFERNLESKFLFGNSFNIDMPDSAWVGNYRFEVYCVDKGFF